MFVFWWDGDNFGQITEILSSQLYPFNCLKNSFQKDGIHHFSQFEIEFYWFFTQNLRNKFATINSPRARTFSFLGNRFIDYMIEVYISNSLFFIIRILLTEVVIVVLFYFWTHHVSWFCFQIKRLLILFSVLWPVPCAGRRNVRSSMRQRPVFTCWRWFSRVQIELHFL